MDCSAGGTVSETLDPGPRQSSSSNLNFHAPDDGAALNVDPLIQEYFFKKLEVK